MVARQVDLRAGDAAGLPNVLQPGLCAFETYRGRTHNWSTSSFKFTHAGGVERVNGGYCCAIERGIEFAPFARGDGRPYRQSHRGQQLANDDRVGREHLAQQGDRGLVLTTAARCGHGAVLDLFACIPQHGASQHILGLSMRRHPKAGHIDADDAHALNFLGQQLQRDATGGGHTQVDDDDGI
jgi:hypothetical protein